MYSRFHWELSRTPDTGKSHCTGKVFCNGLGVLRVSSSFSRRAKSPRAGMSIGCSKPTMTHNPQSSKHLPRCIEDLRWQHSEHQCRCHNTSTARGTAYIPQSFRTSQMSRKSRKDSKITVWALGFGLLTLLVMGESILCISQLVSDVPGDPRCQFVGETIGIRCRAAGTMRPAMSSTWCSP